MMIKANIGLKILALAGAFCIWSYVYITESKNIQLPFNIPIECKGLDQGLVSLINPQQSSVYLTVNAQRNSWQNFKKDDFVAYVDLTGIGEGNYEAEVKATSKNPSASIVSISPSKITLSVEKETMKEVPVQAKTKGKPGELLTVTALRTEPTTATVKGPKGAVDKVLSAVAIIDVEGMSTNKTQNIDLKSLDEQGNELQNISFNPKDVIVEVEIGRGNLNKLISILPKIEGVTASGKWMTGYLVTPSSVSVALNGELEDLKFIETLPININNLDTDREFTTKLKVPNGVDIEDKDLSIKILITVSSINSTKEQPLGFSFSNLSGLKISSFTPNKITGVVSGANDILNVANSGNCYFDIDLSNYKTPGTYSIDLNNSMLKLPGGITLVSFMPSAISITLENK